MRPPRLPRGWPLGGVVLAAALPACSPGPGLPDPLVIQIQVSPPTCDPPDDPQIFWSIRGFKTEQLVNPNAPSDALVVELRVGDAVPLSVESANTFGVDCTGTLASIGWASTTAGVVAFEPADTVRTVLTAVRPGETLIFADLTFKNGQGKRAEPFVFSNVGSGRPALQVVAR